MTVVATDVRSCGILVIDQSTSGAFRFAHKSFLEFLAARVMSESYSVGGAGREMAAAIRAATQISVNDLVFSSEALAFFAEIMAGRSRPRSGGAPGSVDFAQTLFRSLVIGRMGCGWTSQVLSRVELFLVAVALRCVNSCFRGRRKIPLMMFAGDADPALMAVRLGSSLLAGTLMLIVVVTDGVFSLVSSKGLTHGGLRWVVMFAAILALLARAGAVRMKGVMTSVALWAVCVRASDMGDDEIGGVAGAWGRVVLQHVELPQRLQRRREVEPDPGAVCAPR